MMIYATLIGQALVLVALAVVLTFVLGALSVLLILRRWLHSEGQG